MSEKQIARLQSKLAVQRNEIARLTQALENCAKQKAKLLDELKWIKGEKP